MLFITIFFIIFEFAFYFVIPILHYYGKYKVMVLTLLLKNVVYQWLIVKLLENINNLLRKR